MVNDLLNLLGDVRLTSNTARVLLSGGSRTTSPDPRHTRIPVANELFDEAVAEGLLLRRQVFERSSSQRFRSLTIGIEGTRPGTWSRHYLLRFLISQSNWHRWWHNDLVLLQQLRHRCNEPGGVLL